MRNYTLVWLMLLLCFGIEAQAQKPPLDHSVYDSWESIQSAQFSNDGKYLSYEVRVQEGDSRLIVMDTEGDWKVEIPRGYQGSFSNGSGFFACKIRPLYADTRSARIARKKPDDMPKDSMVVIRLANSEVVKFDRVKNFTIPEEGGEWIAYHQEKELPDTAKRNARRLNPDKAALDSAKRVIDSLEARLRSIPERIMRRYDGDDLSFENWEFYADSPKLVRGAANKDKGTTLVWWKPVSGEKKEFPNVLEFTTAKKGGALAMETALNSKDSLSKNAVVYFNTSNQQMDTVFTDFNDVKNLSLDESGKQLAFVAERDSVEKALQKFYRLYYYDGNGDSARMIAQRKDAWLPEGQTVSEHYSLNFSESGDRLLMGMAPVRAVKDTTVPDFERVDLDIWHYQDDDLQTQQLSSLNRALRESFLVVYDIPQKRFVNWNNENFRNIRTSGEGDGRYFYVIDDKIGRIERQWLGRAIGDLYLLDPKTGAQQKIKSGLNGNVYGTNPQGDALVWFDNSDRQWHTYVNGKEFIPSKAVKINWHNEDFDMPTEPNPYGLLDWDKDGKSFYVYDKFDIWKLDAAGTTAPLNITRGWGRKNGNVIRYFNLDRSDPGVKAGEQYVLNLQNDENKKNGFIIVNWKDNLSADLEGASFYPYSFSRFAKAKNADKWAYSVGSYAQSPDIRVAGSAQIRDNLLAADPVYSPNPQQAKYNWGTAELVSWKAYDGKMSKGIVYKPEDFDPKKKYPMIAYFYEKLSDGLYNYQEPAPTPSRLNIPFFVSRGYVVFAPDISYRTGYPGPSAYDYIVSGARHLVKLGYVDSTKMGLQGQSWGGYQTAYIITRTPLFAAAWAGAPVANMTSAYGGIRWGTGLNRQFQYERTQSRIGANLWEKQNLYIENSPLFYLPNVETPLVIMHNDNDGAVPWYQGIELYTGLRRLGKPVWMLNYNGEEHNLIERKNRKDIQRREQQFFDWLLKGENPPVWLKYGVPATEKGINYGWELVGEEADKN